MGKDFEKNGMTKLNVDELRAKLERRKREGIKYKPDPDGLEKYISVLSSKDMPPGYLDLSPEEQKVVRREIEEQIRNRGKPMKKMPTAEMSRKAKGFVDSKTQEAMYRDDLYQSYNPDLEYDYTDQEIEDIKNGKGAGQPIKVEESTVPQDELDMINAEFDSHREEIQGPQSSTTGQDKKDSQS